MEERKCKGNGIFILANPMVDITAKVSMTFLDKFGLILDSSCPYSEDKKLLFEELNNHLKPQCTVGGSTVNTSRIIQWILKVPNEVTIFGAVGNDDNKTFIENALKEEQINFIFKCNNDHQTTRCAVLVTHHKRTLCTDLGASKILDINDLYEDKVWAAVNCAKFFYVSGFFFKVSQKIIFTLAQHALKFDKTFILNIGATFVTEKYPEEFNELLKLTDIVICNEEEIIALYKNLLNKTNKPTVTNAIIAIQKLPSDKKGKRIVVVTRGSESVLVCTKEGEVEEKLVPKVDKIEDTNAAGDAFAGGFIAQYIKGKSIKECVNCGIWAASQIVQNVGCTFDKNIKYEDLNTLLVGTL